MPAGALIADVLEANRALLIRFIRAWSNACDWLLKPENKAELISVLKYHVLPGRSAAADVEKLTAPSPHSRAFRLQ